MTPSMLVATLAWMLLTAGAVTRARPALHRRLVASAMLVDVGLVLYLQVTREAVQQAMRFDRPGLEQAHIGVSTLALVSYVPLAVALFRSARTPDRAASPEAHTRWFWLAYGLRSAGFLLMFSMVGG